MTTKTTTTKITSIILTIVMIVTVFSIGASASTNSLSIGNVTGTVGGEVDVPINAVIADASRGIFIDIEYNSNLILQGVTVNNEIINNDDYTDNTTLSTTSARMMVDWVNSPKTANGTIITLRFKVKDTAPANGTFEINICDNTQIMNSSVPVGKLTIGKSNGSVVVGNGIQPGNQPGNQDSQGDSSSDVQTDSKNFKVIKSNNGKFNTVQLKNKVNISKENKIIAYYTDDKNVKHIITNGHIDKETQSFICSIPSDVTVKTIEMNPAIDKTPSSINNSHWGYEALSYIYSRNIMDDRELNPDSAVTREDIVKYLAKATVGFNLNKYANTSSHFKDTQNNTKYGKFINWAYDNKIIDGYEDGTFRGENLISREEVCAVFVRFLDFYTAFTSTTNEDKTFGDESAIADWSKQYVHALTAKGLIKGAPGENGTNIFEPTSNLTNAEIATIIERILVG